jgi:hypothetical protein
VDWIAATGINVTDSSPARPRRSINFCTRKKIRSEMAMEDEWSEKNRTLNESNPSEFPKSGTGKAQTRAIRFSTLRSRIF